MSAIEQVLQPSVRTLDGLPLRRGLPLAQRRSIGPFTFFDHIGPTQVPAGGGIDVRPHPHIGLATVTYMLSGALQHRDSLGIDQRIEPGAINWMTAGRGIVHSERTPAELRATGFALHVLQLWVALPADQEECEPSFAHHPSDTLPALARDGVQLRVLAGSAYGLSAPVKVASPLFYVEARLDDGASIELPTGYSERAVYVLDGTLECDGDALPNASLVLMAKGANPRLRAVGATHVMLLGGEPLAEPRHIFWNFVSSRRERIREAAEQWRAGNFPRVPGDETEYIPLETLPEV